MKFVDYCLQEHRRQSYSPEERRMAEEAQGEIGEDGQYLNKTSTTQRQRQRNPIWNKNFWFKCGFCFLMLIVIAAVITLIVLRESSTRQGIDGIDKNGEEFLQTPFINFEPLSFSSDDEQWKNETDDCDFYCSGIEFDVSFGCINSSLVCDTVDDCKNGFDENNCIKLSSQIFINVDYDDEINSNSTSSQLPEQQQFNHRNGFVLINANQTWQVYSSSEWTNQDGNDICQYLFGISSELLSIQLININQTSFHPTQLAKLRLPIPIRTTSTNNNNSNNKDFDVNFERSALYVKNRVKNIDDSPGSNSVQASGKIASLHRSRRNIISLSESRPYFIANISCS